MRHCVCSVLAIGCTLVSGLALAQPTSRGITQIAPGDYVSAVGGTPSHRVIPVDESRRAPSMQDFKSPELQQLIQQYQQLKRQQRGGGRQPRDSGRSQPGNNPIRLPQRGFQDQPFPEPGNPSGNPIDPTDTSGQGDDRNGDSNVPGELPNLNLKELSKEIQTQIKDAREKYRDAMKAFNDWPENTVPPDEWLKKVQPLLNPELVRQMNDVIEANRDSAARDNSQAAEPSRKAPDSVISNDEKPSSSMFKEPSKRLLDSVVKMLDESGTEWLKKSGKDRKKNSRLKSLAAKTSNWLAKLNRKVTENSNMIAGQRPTLGGRNATSGESSGSGLTLPTDLPKWDPQQVGAFLLLLAAVAGAAYWLWRHRAEIAASPMRRRKPLDASTICDRESLLQACHQLTQRCFGWPSQFWNHRKLFSRLATHVSSQSGATRSHTVERLRDIYEHARYAPSGLLSGEQIDTARRLFAEIKDEVAAA